VPHQRCHHHQSGVRVGLGVGRPCAEHWIHGKGWIKACVAAQPHLSVGVCRLRLASPAVSALVVGGAAAGVRPFNPPFCASCDVENIAQVLPVGLHLTECELFAAKPVATFARLELRVDYRLEGTR
jgi:hypothetical protein